jgi:hypothetical protein
MNETPPTTDTTPPTFGSRPSRRVRVAHVVRHYLEMVVAMVVGMVALDPIWSAAGDALGWSAVLGRPGPAALIMATNMSIAMSAWMRYRRHGWPATAEMVAAMYVPFLVLFPPMWAGLLSADAMLVGGHLLMLPAMAAAMYLRRDEYAGSHHGDQRARS